jgi:hypothetical protein
MDFVVDNTAINMVSPSALEFLQALPDDHPRVLATQSEITRLRGTKKNDDIRAILREAEDALAIVVPDESEGIPTQKGADAEQDRKFRLDASKSLGDFVYRTVIPLSEAYLVTGDERFAEKAIHIAFEIAKWAPEGVSSLNDFGDARCMWAMAAAYDTFFERLTPGQRKELLDAITIRASRFYSHWINNIEARLLSGHVWQHILHYFFKTSMALYGDVQEASDWLSYAYEVFLARAPVLGGIDGGWIEGVSYFRMNMETMIDIPLFIKKYTDFDFFNAHPWYQGQVEWMLYHIPPGSVADGFADNTEEVDSPGTEYVAFALELAKLTGNERASWYARECQRHEDVDLSDKSTLRWIRLAKTNDLPIPEPPQAIELPMAVAFRDIGMVAMHSHPGDVSQNLMVAMRSSPFGSYGHMLSDQNVFNILYGGKKLFYRTGYKVTMKDPHRTGWYQNTKSQNGILVNGNGQPYSTEAFGWIARFMQGDDLAYAKGDASNAYKSKETREDYKVKKNLRHLILLKPDVVVIYDELAASEEVKWSWLIHSLDNMALDESSGSFYTSLDNVKGIGRLWTSQPVAWQLTDTFDVPAVNWRGSRLEDGSLRLYDDQQWHIKSTNIEPASEMRFLAIIQVAQGAEPINLLQDAVKEGVAEVKIGDWKISANLELSISPGIFIENSRTKTVFSSHGEPIRLGNKTFNGSYSGGSKLGFIRNNKPVFQESVDEPPYVILQRLQNYKEDQHDRDLYTIIK